MRWYHVSLSLLTVAVLVLPASAGFLFGKKTKPNPTERVPELIVIVKTDKDESKRVDAAKELREYDTTVFKDIVPILIDVLLHDAKSSVRSEAAESLGKIRPISQDAGWALEEAHAKDSSMRVRLQAHYALLSYHWSGYHSPAKGKEPQVSSSKDGPALPLPPATSTPKAPGSAVPPSPPVRLPGLWPFGKTTVPSTETSGVRPTLPPMGNESVPPPLAETKTPAPAPRPLPVGPQVQPSPVVPVPVETPAPTPTSTPPRNEGPDLPSPPGGA